MSTDTCLSAQTSPHRDASNPDSYRILAWRKNQVPMSWLMFFDPTDRITNETAHPDLAADLKTATDRYHQRLITYQEALQHFAPGTGFTTLLDYVRSIDQAWLTLSTWELWVCDTENFSDEFERALATVAKGPTSPDWQWMLNWCHPSPDRATHLLFGHGGGRPRPWLPIPN